jgi:hypothetical protein
MKLVSTLFVCLTLALGVGCKKKDEKAAEKPAEKAAEPAGSAAAAAPAPTPAAPAAAAPAGDMTTDAACDKTIAMMTSMADAVTASKDDCNALGTALEKWVADNKSLIEWGKAQDKDPAKKAEFDKVCTPKMAPVLEKLGPAMQGASKCADNEKVKAALAALE